jgi:hypothetical protein
MTSRTLHDDLYVISWSVLVNLFELVAAFRGHLWMRDEEGIRLYEYDYVYDEFDDKLPKQPRPEYVMRVTAPSRKEWVWRFEPEGRVLVRAGGRKDAEKVFLVFITRLYPAKDLRELELYLRAEFRDWVSSTRKVRSDY